MIRTIIMSIFLSGLLARKYLLEVGNKPGDGKVQEGGGEDYREKRMIGRMIRMKEYGRFHKRILISSYNFL